jgi:hypothetical protein
MSRRKITIPADIDAAVADLNGLGALITAKEWHRAAIVATFVSLADGKGKRNASSSISPAEFAALGIHGLKSKDTVRRYVQIWETSGEPIPTPGQEIEIPDVEWKTWVKEAEAEGEVTEGTKKTTDYVTAPRVAEAIKSDPRIAEAAITAAVEAAPAVAAKAVAKSEKATAGYAEVRKEEADERAKAAGIKVEKAKPTASTKSMAAAVASRNAVSDWLMLIHEASAKLSAAEKMWASVEGDLIAEDLSEANASLIDAESDAVVLRQRVSDKNASLSGTSV